MAEKMIKFGNPNGIKFSMEKNLITMNFAYAKGEKSGEFIEEDNILKELSISFNPETFIFTIAAMLKIVESYQETYDVNLGLSADRPVTTTEGLTNAT